MERACSLCLLSRTSTPFYCPLVLAVGGLLLGHLSVTFCMLILHCPAPCVSSVSLLLELVSSSVSFWISSRQKYPACVLLARSLYASRGSSPHSERLAEDGCHVTPARGGGGR